MIEVIPAGASAVVTTHGHDHEHSHNNNHVDIIEAIKDTEADLERSGGQHYGNSMIALKDAEANIRFAIKDTESNIGRTAGSHFGETLKTIKESECATEQSKAKIVEEIKNSDYRQEKSDSKTRELFGQGFKEASFQEN